MFGIWIKAQGPRPPRGSTLGTDNKKEHTPSTALTQRQQSQDKKTVPKSRFITRLTPTIAILLGLQSSNALAADYHWKLYQYPSPSFPSASEACKYYDNGDVYHKFHSFGLESESIAMCYSLVFTPPIFFSYARVWRDGSGCTPPKIYDEAIGGCIKPSNTVAPSKDLGTPEYKINTCTTDITSINLALGNTYLTEVDHQQTTAAQPVFYRTYNSMDGIWRHNYSTKLTVQNSTIILTKADGKQSHFTLSGTAAVAEQSELGSLTRTDNEWIYISPRNERFTFDTSGRLIRHLDTTGAEVTLTYEQLYTTVTDHQNNQLQFSSKHSTDDHATQPTEIIAGQVEITFNYDINGQLNKATWNNAGLEKIRSFHYEDHRNTKLLTGITDERGIRYATWAYDDQGRAISSEHAGGAERTLVSYNTDGSSTVTNALGKRTTYRFQTIQGIRRITAIEGEPSANCPNSNSTFTYDDRGLVKTRTDNKGNVTTFDYNERGLEISRTEAFGTPQERTVTTEWHPTLFLPMTITEPDRSTSYSYDTQGRLIEQATTQR
ncbi:DUF6531 domain-containing protein [Aquipseudomonas alcaligenes]